ncbi:(2Fe-2S)-binding protein [Candidatus Bipolaricaulota bacterium]|nr:(2Fe-2S)-binding protein [Candidatus Bipolaricaulota bacterium]
MASFNLTVNGVPQSVEAPADTPLLWVLRDDLELTGTKYGCGVGQCGACTVLLNGNPITSCLMLAVEADGSDIETIEGEAIGGELSVLQQAFIDEGATQCGFCTPGMIMSARGLLNRIPDPSHEEIIEAIAGNLCRCTGYEAIISAIQLAAARLSQDIGSRDAQEGRAR